MLSYTWPIFLISLLLAIMYVVIKRLSAKQKGHIVSIRDIKREDLKWVDSKPGTDMSCGKHMKYSKKEPKGKKTDYIALNVELKDERPVSDKVTDFLEQGKFFQIVFQNHHIQKTYLGEYNLFYDLLKNKPLLSNADRSSVTQFLKSHALVNIPARIWDEVTIGTTLLYEARRDALVRDLNGLGVN
jgi:hypothetical protein